MNRGSRRNGKPQRRVLTLLSPQMALPAAALVKLWVAKKVLVLVAARVRGAEGGAAGVEGSMVSQLTFCKRTGVWRAPLVQARSALPLMCRALVPVFAY